MSLLHLDAFAHTHTHTHTHTGFHTDAHGLIVETRSVCGSVGSFELQTTCNHVVSAAEALLCFVLCNKGFTNPHHGF